MMRTIPAFLVALMVLFSGVIHGQDRPEDILQVEALTSVDVAYPGGELLVGLRLNILPGWHINAHTPRDEFLFATTVSFDTLSGLEIVDSYFPEGEEQAFPFSDQPMLVYDGETKLAFRAKVSADLQPGDRMWQGSVTYQACNDHECLAPHENSFHVSVSIASNTQPTSMINSAFFEGLTFGDGGAAAADGDFGARVASRGLMWTFILTFLGGLALNLTPCVYPLIPITISYFGGQSAQHTGRAPLLAAVYVLGMALTYSILGVVAAFSGSMLGVALQNPFVLMGVAVVLIGLALSMFGLYEITVPQFLLRTTGGSRSGYGGALFMGLTVGVVAAPCIGPFVLGLLTYVGSTGDPLLGFGLFFSLALGLGLPFLVLATFAGAMDKFPRSGVWMVWVRHLFGFVLIGMAVYFLEPLLPGELYTWLLVAVAVVGAIFLVISGRSAGFPKVFLPLQYGLPALMIVLAAWLAWPGDQAEGITWKPFTQASISQAASLGSPVIIDFSADWCVPCKELDKFTFTDEAVQERATEFVTLKADLTQFGSPQVKALRDEFGIRGVPTIVFIGKDGKERKELRAVGFIKAEDMLSRMDRLLKM